MAPNNAGVKAARAALTNSHEFANEKVDPSCTKCAETPPIRAIILYPNIGTPLIVPPGEQYLTFFIAAENSSREHFGVRRSEPESFPAPPLAGYRYVDNHLRVHSISNKKVKEDTDEARLWNDGKLCGKAYENVKVWCVGSFDSGTIKDIDGNIFANIRKRTLEQYKAIGAAHPDAGDKNTENVPMTWVYQIRIKLDSIPNLPSNGAIASMAWMVTMPDKYKKQTSLTGMNDWEYQDKLIYDFLEAQKKNSKKSHVPELYEFSLSAATVSSSLPEQTKNLSHRLKAWHPFVIGTKKKLSVGHLSDVHINARQFAMAKSNVQVIEGISPKLDSKVDITFVALKNLFDEMKKEGADILFITGDLLDFNRNLDPTQVGPDVHDQWKKFNVKKNIDNPKIYKRGLDDMLMFSLLRYSYEKLQLPVFITTGNHEAYDIPYGIPPRKNNKTYLTGYRETIGDIDPPGSEEAKPQQKPKTTYSNDIAIRAIEKGSTLILRGMDYYLKENDKFKNKIFDRINENAYVRGKANEGIAADHNLTIYEACLIYGPTYAQAITSQNFTPDNYDWFFTLFTPLCDYVVDYHAQRIIGLDWGPGENYLNALGKLNPLDTQGIGILPRASESINNLQKTLLENAFFLRKSKPSSTLLFTHFTFVNFGLDVPFKNGQIQNIFDHEIGSFNQFNFGTCEKEQLWLYEKCINNQVQYHFSGHSHRSGVYSVGKQKRQVVSGKSSLAGNVAIAAPEFYTTSCTLSGFDPGIDPNHKDNIVSNTTKLIVSSCGGPIGVQNHDNELFAFNLQLPSGTLLNEDAVPPIKLIKADSKKVPFSKPRLCVALDYLWIIWEMSDKKNAEEPILFLNPDQTSFKPGSNNFPKYFDVRLGEKIRKLDCISEINFFAFTKFGQSKSLQKIKAKYSSVGSGTHHSHRITFENKAALTTLDSLILLSSDSSPPVLFCEVTLKKPKGAAVQHFNYDDKWYFPVEAEKLFSSWWTLSRPSGEKGELPDWDWLGKAFPEKYPVAEDARKW